MCYVSKSRLHLGECLCQLAISSLLSLMYLEAAIQRCSENILQIYRVTPMPKCDFNRLLSNFIEIALRHVCSHVNLLHTFGTHFLKNTSEGLLLCIHF